MLGTLSHGIFTTILLNVIVMLPILYMWKWRLKGKIYPLLDSQQRAELAWKSRFKACDISSTIHDFLIS